MTVTTILSKAVSMDVVLGVARVTVSVQLVCFQIIFVTA